MRKLKGIKRKDGVEGAPSPSAAEWRLLEERIASAEFSNGDRRSARNAIRALNRYDSFSTKVHVEKLSPTGKTILDNLLAELGFEFDFSDPPRLGTPPKRGKPDLRIV